MRIESIYIDDFRGLRRVQIDELDEHVNLFVGENGAGKSSIIDAMSLVFSWYIARMLSVKGRGKDIPKDDINKFSADGARICMTLASGESFKLYRTNKYKKLEKSDLSAMNRMIAEIRNCMDVDELMSVPVVASYGVNRVIKNKYSTKYYASKSLTALNAYKEALGGEHLFSEFFRWFRHSEDFENQMIRDGIDYHDRGLETVRDAMGKVFPEYSDMKVSRRPLALVMKKGDDVFKLSQLSDGEKCYISLVCDLARRMSIANPAGNPLEGEGVVMIDEVDLHLHPKWQQTVISRLVETFPNIQFFITTHSPIVASDANGSVFSVKEGVVEQKHTYGRLSSAILSSVFDISSARSMYVNTLVDSIYDCIGRLDEEGYETKMEELISLVGVDDDSVTGLRIEKARRDRARVL